MKPAVMAACLPALPVLAAEPGRKDPAERHVPGLGGAADAGPAGAAKDPAEAMAWILII